MSWTSAVYIYIGTGKSVLLREIIKALRFKYKKEGDAVAVTASTGIAACNIGGVTLHNFAGEILLLLVTILYELNSACVPYLGFGLGKNPVEQLCSIIRKNRKALSRWQRTKVLIIDEGTFVYSDRHGLGC